MVIWGRPYCTWIKLLLLLLSVVNPLFGTYCAEVLVLEADFILWLKLSLVYLMDRFYYNWSESLFWFWVNQQVIQNPSDMNKREGGGEGERVVTIQWYLSFRTPLLKRHVHSRDTKLDSDKCSYSVLSILPNKPVRNHWKYQEKMARYFSV